MNVDQIQCWTGRSLFWWIAGIILWLGQADLYGQRSFAYGLGQAVQSGTTLGGCALSNNSALGTIGSSWPSKHGCIHIQSTQLYQVQGLYQHQVHSSIGLRKQWKLSAHIESLGVEGASLVSGQGGLSRVGQTVDVWIGPWAEHNPFKLQLPWSFGTDLWTRIKFSDQIYGHVYLSSEVWPSVSSGVDVWVEAIFMSKSTVTVGRSWMPLWGTRHSLILRHGLFERIHLQVGLQALAAYASERSVWTQFGGVSLSQRAIGIGFYGEIHPVLGWSMGASLRWEPRNDE